MATFDQTCHKVYLNSRYGMFGGYTYPYLKTFERKVIDTDIARMLPEVDIIKRSLIDDAVAKYICNDIEITRKLIKEKKIMANMKFKVGDKVKIITSGTICTVREAGCSLNGRKGYKLFMNGSVHPCIWWDEELEPMPFTKADLKDGMVIEYRNGTRRLVLNEKFLATTGTGWMDFDDYDDELIYCVDGESDPDLDIVKIYSSDAKCMPTYCKDYNLELIWERKEEEPEHKEMTVEEIEEKLGYKVKIVGNE